MNKLVVASSLALAISQLTFASEVRVVGTIPTVVKENRPAVNSAVASQPNIVLLQKVKLTATAKQALIERANRLHRSAHRPAFTRHTSLPSQVDLGMNNTPVLNQGAHGSCVTFANTGALDALIGEGNYVSQLCSLTLGNYLEEQDPNYPSGWNGSWGPIVLKQLFDYGIVSMQNQKQYGCGGLTSYPLWDPSETGETTDPETYLSMSESIQNKFQWQPIINLEETFKGDEDPEEALAMVKNELNAGNRVTFGVLLDVYRGGNGALGSYKARHDTWMLTPSIEEDARNDRIDAGHEMIIIGYDDDAVVTSSDGTENKGLLILRNSWGSFAGDHGNYYMSYDHFKLLTLEAQVLKAND